MGRHSTWPIGYRVSTYVRGDGKVEAQQVFDPDLNLVSSWNIEAAPGTRPPSYSDVFPDAADPLAVSEAAHREIEHAGALEAGMREAEDRMDVYEALLDAGEKPVVVLCRAATRRPPDEEFYAATATLLHETGGLTAPQQKNRRKVVKRWCEGGRMSAVPQHCWALLLKALPASSLKERLAKIGGGQ
jgi:hypothetical protein